jgi:hypothetical protein
MYEEYLSCNLVQAYALFIDFYICFATSNDI